MAWLLLGCVVPIVDSYCYDSTGCGKTTTDEVRLAATTSWDVNGVTVKFVGAEYQVSALDFGMVQTGSATGWAGEDCISDVPDGYENVDDQGFQICHPFAANGGRLLTVDKVDAVVAGETTWLHEADEDTITYVVFQGSNIACWTWGDDPGYYAKFGCEIL